MVVCIPQTYGDNHYSSSIAYEESQNVRVSTSDKIIRQYLRPNFHCSNRPANLNVVCKYTVHPVLASMWLEAEEWHLLPSDHCDVYGFNLWNPAWLDESTDMVFGGEEGRKNWLKKQKNNVSDYRGSSSSIESCANDGWVCCMAFSEFDYLLICLDERKREYGNLHHINTRAQNESYCCTMDEFVHFLASFVKEGKDRKRSEMSGRISKSRPQTSMTRPLKMIRRACIDALTR